MRGRSKYVIPFKGLKTGNHKFVFDINKDFFEQYTNTEIRETSCTVEVDLIKQPRILELSIHITGFMEVRCDRCFEYFQLSRDIKKHMYVKVSENEEPDSDEIIHLSEKEHKLDLSQFLYDYMVLSLTYQSIHPNDENGKSMCNPDIIEQLNTYSGRSKNVEETDPRWNSLKSLMNNKKLSNS